VPIAEYVRFLTHWQHATPDSRLEGRAGLLEVLEQLQGIEAPAAEWESQILPARVTGYDPRWLDEVCLSGEIVWGRLTPRAETTGRSGTPSPATPLAFVLRGDLEDMLRAVRAGALAPEPEVGAAADVLAALPTPVLTCGVPAFPDAPQPARTITAAPARAVLAGRYLLMSLPRSVKWRLRRVHAG